ncbi:MAG: hypothetical protein WEB85_07940 [Dongiaceae bacterium]
MTRPGLLAASPAAAFASLGAVSGSIATVILFILPDSLRFQAFDWLELTPFAVVPGAVFGVVFAAVLHRRRLAGPWSGVAYVAAATASYLAAYTFAINAEVDDLLGLRGVFWLNGLAAGLLGGACLAALSAALFRFARRLRPCLLMAAAGCLLGALLDPPLRLDDNFDNFWLWLGFFAVWQAGYAAAFATALPARIAAA